MARMRAVTERAEAHELDSNAIDATMRITPSIIVDRLRSIDASTACEAYTRGTNEHHQFELGFKAIGFGTASTTNP